MKRLNKIAAVLAVFLISLFAFNLSAIAEARFSVVSSVVEEKSENVVATISTGTGSSIDNRVVFHDVDDYVVFNLTIKNNASYPRKVLGITDNNTNTAISYAYDDHADKEIAAGGTFNLKIRITCLEISDTLGERDINNRVTFSIAYYEDTPAPVTGSEEIDILVPNTGFGTGVVDFCSSNSMVMAVFVVAAFGALVFFIKKGTKTPVKILAIVIVAAVIIPFAAKADDDVSTITFDTEIALRDMIHIHWREYIDGELDYDDEWDDDYLFIRDEYPTIREYVGIWDYPYDGLELVGATSGINGPDLVPEDLILDDMDMVFYFEAETYEITYHLDGGTISENAVTSCGTNDEFMLETPVKEGFRFDGWDTGSGWPETEYMVYGCYEDMDFYARWSQPETYVYYNTNGHGDINGNTSTTIEAEYAEEYYTIAAPQVDHYDFLGWDTEQDGTGTRYDAGDLLKEANELIDYIELYAQWMPTEYEITYVLDGGAVSETNPETYNVEGTYTINKPTREGKLFVGWTSSFILSPQRNVTLDHEAYGPITFTANWSDPVPDITNFEYMQDVSTLNCLATEVGVSKTMKDKRNNQEYLIRKLRDENCWMTDSLNLYNITITSELSDFSDKEAYTVPDSTTSVYSFSGKFEGENFPQDEVYFDTEHPEYGAYYTFYAATAQWDGAVPGTNSPQSICPRNWRLPTGGDGGEFEILSNLYPTAEEMLDEEGPHFLKNGLRSGNNTSLPGDDGSYWSSTTDSHTTSTYQRYRYYLLITSRNYDGTGVLQTRISPKATIDKKNGPAVRCLLR